MYRAFWITAFVSNLGTWVHEIGAQWLMPQLDPSPVMVSSVRTAVALPVFLMCLPAGVLADRWDRRKLLIGTQTGLAAVAIAMTILTWTETISPTSLLVLSFLMGLGMAIHVPTWQSVVPEIIPTAALPAAIGLGSISFNLARSIGPALGGFLVAHYSSSIAFLLNALSFIGIIFVLLAWKRDIPSDLQKHAHEPFFQSMLTGISFVLLDKTLRNCLILAAFFVMPASVIWSLLPLVVKDMLHLQAEGFGTMMGLLGVGAVVAAFFLPWLRGRLGSNGLIAVQMMVFGLALMAMGTVPTVMLVALAMPILGMAWMSTLTTLQATAQVLLPHTHRARGMSTYLMTFSVTMAAGSLIWGLVAEHFGLPATLWYSGIAMFIGSIASQRFSIGQLPTLTVPADMQPMQKEPGE